MSDPSQQLPNHIILFWCHNETYALRMVLPEQIEELYKLTMYDGS